MEGTSRGTATVPNDHLGQNTVVGVAETLDHVLECLLKHIVAHNVQPRVLVVARVDVARGAY